MEECYSFHTFLLKEIKKSYTLAEMVDLFEEVPYSVDAPKLSKWTNSKQPIPQKFLPYIEKLAMEHLQSEIMCCTSNYFTHSK